MGRLVLETVTLVTVASFQKGPAGGCPMAVLSKAGVGETLELREQLEKIKDVGPLDCAFVAMPGWMSGVAGEMLITLTGDERTGYAEVPRMDHHLALYEHSDVARIEGLNATSLMIIFSGRDKTNASFLLEYGMGRKEALLDFAEIQESHHVLVLGLPIFVQAIAWAFAKGKSAKREVETIVWRNASVVQIDYTSGVVEFPAKQLAR